MDSVELCSGSTPEDPRKKKDEILNGKNPKADKKLLDDIFNHTTEDAERAEAEADAVIRHNKDGSIKIGGKDSNESLVNVYAVECKDKHEFFEKCADESARLRKQLRDAVARIYDITNYNDAMNLYMNMVKKYADAMRDKQLHPMDVVAVMAVAYVCHDLYVQLSADEEGE